MKKTFKGFATLCIASLCIFTGNTQTPNQKVGNIEREGRVNYNNNTGLEDLDKKPIKQEAEKIFEIDQPAEFPGGLQALGKWLSCNLTYPTKAQENNIEGKILVQFIVEKDGSISNPVIARGVDKDLDAEAIRIVSIMPKWKPGMNDGKPVRSKMTLPVAFKLTNNEVK